jgi:hypothetical protein
MNARTIAGRRRTIGKLAPSREFLLLASLFVLSLGSTIRLGTYSPLALELVVVAAVLMAGAMVNTQNTASGPLPWTVLGGGTAAIVLISADPLGVPRNTLLAAVLVAAIVGLFTVRGPVLRCIAAAVATGALVGVLVAALGAQRPAIDVFQSLQGASNALLHGQNPYQPFFPVEVAVGPFAFVTVTAHFDYLPGAAIITAPGRLFGDVRFMGVIALFAVIVFAVRLAWQSPEPRTRVARIAALCLAVPMMVAVIYVSWVDIYSMVGFAGWIVLRRDHPRWSIVFLVITLTVKPVILIALVPALLWSRRARLETLIAVPFALALILPFALATGVGNFYQDVVGIQTSQNFRGDGLTLNAAWYAVSGHTLPVWFGLLAGAAVAFFALRRRPADLADVLCSGALLSTAVFLLAKWAFLNYYFIPVWLLVLALAGRGMPFERSAVDVALPAAGLVRRREVLREV